MSKGTMKFGSMRDMQAAGLMVADDAIDELFKSDDTYQLLREKLQQAELERRHVGIGIMQIDEGIYILPTPYDFRGKVFSEWRVIVSGMQGDEAFYLAFYRQNAHGLVGMDVFFRDGCGRPGLEAPLYELVLARFRRLLEILSK